MNVLSGQTCESGWLFEGGIRLEVGPASLTVRFGPAPSHERYLDVYNA